MAYKKIGGKWVQTGPKVHVTFKSPETVTADKIQSLLDVAKKNNLEKEVKIKEKKLSGLQRLGIGLNAFNPVNAIALANEGKADPVTQYIKDIGTRMGSAVTGKIPSKPDISGAEFVGSLGVKNKIAKFGLGFAADVLLDPTTYFGGAIAKGAFKAGKFTLSPVGKLAKKVAPGTTAKITNAAQGAKDAVLGAVSKGYGASKGALNYATDVQGKLDEDLFNIFKESELRTGVLSKSQRELAGAELAATRRKVFEATVERQQKLAREYEAVHGKLPEGEVGTVLKGLEKEATDAISRNQDTIVRLQQRVRIISTTGAKVSPVIERRIAELTRDNARLVNNLSDQTRFIEGIRDARNVVRKEFDKVPDLTKKGFTPAQQAVVAREVARNRQLVGGGLVKEGLLSKETIPEVYYPSIMKNPDDLAKLQNLLNDSKHFGTGSENYLKQYRALLKEKDLVLDFGKAYSAREAEVLKDLTLRKELRNFIKLFGTTNESTAKGLKYVPITSKGYAGKIGKVVGYVSKPDAKLLGAFLGEAEFHTLDLIAKRLGFDAVTSLFKRAVTGLFAPFHIRNWVSGILQNYEMLGPAALNPRNMALGSRIAKKILSGGDFGDEVIDIGKGATMKMTELMQKIKYRFYGGSFIADLGDATKVLADQGKVISNSSLKSTVKTIGLGSEAVPFRAARKVGEFIETQQKATAVVTALGQGKTLDEALDLARQAGFDYRNLTGFESKIMRRIVPFYAFARFNAELQIKTILKHPDRVNNIVKAFRNAGDAFGGSTAQEDRETLPDYLANGFGFKIGVDKNNNPVYTNSFGTPIEAFMQWFDKNPILKVMSNMNPILKTPLELGVGKDSFRQRDLSMVYSANEYSGAPQIIKDLLQLKPVVKDKFENGKPTGEKYTIYVANPQRLLIARGLFTSRGATYLDQIFDGDVKGVAKALNLITGIKAFPVDLERTKEFQLRDQQRAIEDILLRYGAAREFRNVYVPKPKFNPGLKK